MTSPAVYRLVGPEDLFRDAPFMGLYTEKAGKGRSVSVHSGGKFKLFYCEPKGQWIVGVDVNSGEGWLFIESDAVTPDKARGGWSFWDSRKNDWVCDPDLRVVLANSSKDTSQKPLSELLSNISLGPPSNCSSIKGAKNLKLPKSSAGRISMDNFQTIRIIGKGSFGEVRAVVKKGTGEVYAIKRLRKKEMIHRNQVKHIWGERRFLAGADNPWVVRLFHSFQDKKNLYFVLEYCPGGDFLRLLIQKERLSEKNTAFYIAEIACGLQSVHDLGFIHRDIKPDNILISGSGHLKLTDFGLCKQLAKDADKKIWEDVSHRYDEKKASKPVKKGRRKQQSCVGTPDYVAPEVLKRDYGRECDWWSVGVILYESIVGYPPFMSDSLQETAKRIVDFKKYLKFPRLPKLSSNAMSIIGSMLCEAKDRIKFHDLCKHPFFASIDWKNLASTKPPFVPEVKDKKDTGNFDKFDDKSIRGGHSVRGDTAKLNFPEFTWDRRPTPSGRADVFSSTFFDDDNIENNPNAIAQAKKH